MAETIKIKSMSDAIGTFLVGRIKRRMARNEIKPPSEKKWGKKGTTLVDSGRLLRSIQYRVNSNGSIEIGSPLEYAQIQHEGGIIKPTKSKFLAIPMCAKAKANSPRDFEDTFVKFYGSYGVIFKMEEDGKVKALYTLKKSVKIPSRPYLFIDDKDKDRIAQIALKHIELSIPRNEV